MRTGWDVANKGVDLGAHLTGDTIDTFGAVVEGAEAIATIGMNIELSDELPGPIRAAKTWWKGGGVTARSFGLPWRG